MDRSELLDRYLKGIDVLAEAMRDVPPNIMDKAPAPGKWSIRQNLLHLVDAELVNAGRLRLLAAQPGSQLLVFDQNRWTQELHYEKQPIDDALAVFRGVRTITANMLRATTPENWDNKGVHPVRGEMTIVSLLELGTNHLESHARTIRELRDRFRATAVA